MTLGVGWIEGTAPKTKKDLKAAVGKSIEFEETSMFGPEFKGDGAYSVVGPSPTVRKWFARVIITNGLIAKVE